MLTLLLPLLAAFADSIYLTITKVFFRRFGRVDSRDFSWAIFAVIVGILLLVVPTLGQIPSLALVQANWNWLIVVVALASTYNLLFYWGLEHEKISEVEPFLLFNPLAAILIAGLFYPDERVLPVYLAGGAATVILMVIHLKRNHLKLTRGLLAILGFIFLHGLELSIIRYLLDQGFPPLGLYLVRCLLVLAVLTAILKPRFKIFSRVKTPYLLGIGVAAVCAIWGIYSSITVVGIGSTMLVFILSPLLLYWFSIIVLKEKWHFKNVIASVAMLLLLVWVNLIK